jgi:hypothetical protein
MKKVLLASLILVLLVIAFAGYWFVRNNPAGIVSSGKRTTDSVASATMPAGPFEKRKKSSDEKGSPEPTEGASMQTSERYAALSAAIASDVRTVPVSGEIMRSVGPKNVLSDANAGPSSTGSFQGASKVLSHDYFRFFEIAGMQGQEREQMMAILLDERETRMDALNASGYSELTMIQKNESAQGLWRETEARVNKVFGAETVALFVEYRKTLPSRPLAELTADQWAAEGVAAAPSTVDALAKALSEGPVNLAYSGNMVSADTYNSVTRRDSKVIEAASGLLSPKQTEILQKVLAKRMTVR